MTTTDKNAMSSTTSDSTSAKPIRLLIVDDHAVMREGLKRILSEMDDFVIAAEASSGEEAVKLISQAEYDIVLMDLAMPGRGGMEAVREIHRLQPDTAVLVLSMYPDEQYAIRAFRAGAAGYIMKDRSPDELVAAIRKVAAGRAHITLPLAERLAREVAGGLVPYPHETLSEREDQVMRRLVEGMSIRDIAVKLDLSPKTVSTYKRRLFQKLGAKSVAELIHYCMEHEFR